MKEKIKEYTLYITLFLFISSLLSFSLFNLISFYERETRYEHVEYEIELLNQTVVRIYSVRMDTTYYCHPDSIKKTIDLDNL